MKRWIFIFFIMFAVALPYISSEYMEVVGVVDDDDVGFPPDTNKAIIVSARIEQSEQRYLEPVPVVEPRKLIAFGHTPQEMMFTVFPASAPPLPPPIVQA